MAGGEKIHLDMLHGRRGTKPTRKCETPVTNWPILVDIGGGTGTDCSITGLTLDLWQWRDDGTADFPISCSRLLKTFFHTENLIPTRFFREERDGLC